MNETLIAQSENSKLFRRQSSPFLHSKTTNPLKTERANSKEKIHTPKLYLLSLLTHDAKKTRPHASEIHGQMADSARMTLIVDFGRSRQFSDPDRNDHCSVSTAMRNSYLLC